MGVVYRARDLVLERVVALKVVAPELAAEDPGLRERFLRDSIEAIESRLGRPARRIGDMGGSDSGILVDAGIPCAIFDPSGGGNPNVR